MRAHIADTRTVTMMVSNIPAAPSFMLFRRPMKSTVPVGSTMAIPATMPTRSTTNTFNPMMPPISTST